MLTGEVDLGRIKLAGKRSRLSLTLESSCAISLSDTTRKEVPTAAELAEASSNGQIWISKAGSCQLKFLTLINEEPLDDSMADPSLVLMVANLAAECQVWKELGLDLRLRHAPGTVQQQQESSLTYFLHHPDLSSGLIAPEDVHAAQFQALDCMINFELVIATHDQVSEEVENTDTQVDDREELPKTEAPRHTHGPRRDSKRTDKAQKAMEDVLSKTKTAKTPVVGSTLGRVGDLEEDDITEMAHMVDAAFRKLIGTKRASPGIKIIKTTPMPSLVEIAPAVWNLQYLQSMATHSKVIPVISAGVSRLTNAKSASLRDKVQKLARREAVDSKTREKTSTEESARGEIKKRLWLLCQTTIRADPTKRPSIQRRTKGKGARVDSPEWELAAEYFDPSNYMLEAGPDDTDEDDNYRYEEEGYSCDEIGGKMAELPGSQYEMLEEGPESDELQPGPFSEGLTGSSEGEYFYLDTEGNMIPVEREAVVEEEAEEGGLEWETSSQLEAFHIHDGLYDEEQGISEEDHHPYVEETHAYEHGFHTREEILDEGDAEYVEYGEGPRSDLPEDDGQGYVEYDQEDDDLEIYHPGFEHHDGYESGDRYPDDERYIMYHEEQYLAGDPT
ncbi:hypothetical protein QBC38DRAFT_113049 [Podospora fimiseda]|uniref:Uncharacterized protein n=1 Tax=Podospora fimiseda TaxID=252190 RepID=A0AAN6YN17_9PEZI|nr:hypothetical protein QBC38DRAFT_113049 [Podospora fimiseda]